MRLFTFCEFSAFESQGSKSGNRRTANIQSVGYSDLFALGKDDLTEVLLDFPEAKEMLEVKGREMLLRMGLLDEAIAPSEVENGRVVTKVGPMENSLDLLQTRMARLMAELESSFQKVSFRLDCLENVLEVDEGLESEGNVKIPGSPRIKLNNPGLFQDVGPDKSQPDSPHAAQELS
ncbi:hypothetical protein chiPu_0028695 [Chiloscyllium punctatum]|uniref:Cyclic nucleotide-gated channel C-terminal leucine zipper domain-containing protein n=1 Tax=Chiloscyllium punctatum TaxID=137246 RepID=A0A401TNU3_CHIPU|nr:hypothetical protein [Chiloscyllium punctatum]